jgi:transmembrane sensor
MFFKNKTNWNLLAKYIAGETSEEEKKAVVDWAAKKPENSSLLKDINTDWKKMDSMKTGFDVDKAWNKLHSRIAGDQPAVQTLPPSGKTLTGRFSMTMRIAASLLLLVVVGASMVAVYNRISTITVTATLDEKGKSVELPDGSFVYLNTNSSLSYPGHFSHNSREVRLEGEAYFEVKHEKQRAFVIEAGDARIRVLGTSFNVNTRNSDKLVEVYVTTGLVELSDKNDPDNHIYVKPGNIGLLDHSRMNLVLAENANSIAWKTRTLTFSDTPLKEAISLLRNVYDANITLEGKGIDTIRINGSYQGDPLEIILNAIHATNPELTIAKSKDTIYLSQ